MSSIYHNNIYTITEAPIEEDFNTKEVIDTPYAYQTLKFRLLDDDNEVYFIGFIKPTMTETLFYPLDSIGASYGCTSIEIFENGKWEVV